MTLRRYARTSLALFLAAFALVACSTPTLPTLNPEAATRRPPDLVDIAAAYEDCMTSAGLSVYRSAGADGRATLVEFDQLVVTHWKLPSGQVGGTQAVPPSQRIAWGEEHVDRTGEYVLESAGIDYSSDFQRCHQETGYDEYAALGIPDGKPDATYIAGVVEKSNAWAGCAREHGWPRVADTSIPAQGSDEWPEVMLPVTITPDQLETLLSDCPVHDPEAAAKAMEDPIGSPLIQPSISFELPPGQSAPSDPTEVEALQRHITELTDILFAAQVGE